MKLQIFAVLLLINYCIDLSSCSFLPYIWVLYAFLLLGFFFCMCLCLLLLLLLRVTFELSEFIIVLGRHICGKHLECSPGLGTIKLPLSNERGKAFAAHAPQKLRQIFRPLIHPYNLRRSATETSVFLLAATPKGEKANW